MTFVTLPGQVGPLLGPALGGLLGVRIVALDLFDQHSGGDYRCDRHIAVNAGTTPCRTRRFDLSGFLLLAVGMAVLTLALDGSKGTGLSPLTIAGLVRSWRGGTGALSAARQK
ncbi:putative multidrug resistance protein [Escherichia coli]|nr:putative multidrug resistance protein [Escherichia coli]